MKTIVPRLINRSPRKYDIELPLWWVILIPTFGIGLPLFIFGSVILGLIIGGAIFGVLFSVIRLMTADKPDGYLGQLLYSRGLMSLNGLPYVKAGQYQYYCAEGLENDEKSIYLESEERDLEQEGHEFNWRYSTK